MENSIFDCHLNLFNTYTKITRAHTYYIYKLSAENGKVYQKKKKKTL